MKLDWTKISSSLGIKGQTATALQAFKKRHDDARRKVQVLGEQAQEIDFQRYRTLLKDQSAVNEIETFFKTFKPVTYDVGRQIRAIEAFEAQAIKNAQLTKGKVDLELLDLEKTLKNIEEARPFEDLTVVCFFLGGGGGNSSLLIYLPLSSSSLSSSLSVVGRRSSVVGLQSVIWGMIFLFYMIYKTIGR